jgi:hypothetical protein
MSGVLGLAYPSLLDQGLTDFITHSSLSDRSFSIYLNSSYGNSFMKIPGRDEDSYDVIATHSVAEKSYWSLRLSNLSFGNRSIDVSTYLGVVDTGVSMIIGPKSLINPLIEGVEVS